MRIMHFYTIEEQTRGYSSKLDNKGYDALFDQNGELDSIEMVKIFAYHTIWLFSILGIR